MGWVRKAELIDRDHLTVVDPDDVPDLDKLEELSVGASEETLTERGCYDTNADAKFYVDITGNHWAVVTWEVECGDGFASLHEAVFLHREFPVLPVIGLVALGALAVGAVIGKMRG